MQLVDAQQALLTLGGHARLARRCLSDQRGIGVVQIFDSWAGSLPDGDGERGSHRSRPKPKWLSLRPQRSAILASGTRRVRVGR